MSLTNVSMWDSLYQSKQLDRFEPMLALAREMIVFGAFPARPVMNHQLQWSFGPGITAKCATGNPPLASATAFHE